MGIAAHLFELTDENKERTNGEIFDLKKDVPAVEFTDVSFKYDNEKKILENLNFQVLRGEKIALIGSSGGGKTTLFKLLCGFYGAQSGLIKLYGIDMNKWSLSALRSLIALVSQDIHLFPGTIAENIGYGAPEPSLDEVINAAKAANAHDFIMELPKGYNTIIGEDGARLSGGEKQRISIARAILKDAPILLLDEPTSALDTQSEALVQEVFNKIMKNKTEIVIAHRLSTIKECDRVLVLDQGTIMETGSHEELLLKDGVYKKLYNKQVAFCNSNL
jgi:ABC-type multidrug transport system fused ATPase/permease subunit